MRSIAEILEEREPSLAKLERERDVLEIQRRFYEVTGLLAIFPLSAEDLAALRIRDAIVRGRS